MIAPKKSSKSKQLNYILTPKHISTPNSRDLGSAKSFKFITETNYTDNCIPTITDLKLNSFSTTVSQSASSIDMRFPAVSSPKLSQKKLKSYMKEMQQFLPEGAASDKRTEIKQKSIKRKPIVRKKTRKLESSAENTINLMKKPRIKLRKDTPNGGLGELMQLMHKKKIKGPPGGDPHQQLTERLYFTAINEPEEVFRIVASPNYSLDKLVSKKIEKKFE